MIKNDNEILRMVTLNCNDMYIGDIKLHNVGFMFSLTQTVSSIYHIYNQL